MLTDHLARAQAILPDQSFIVQAPAGSGKTELLTQRVLSLLANNAKAPESIWAITFTKKAAHEMRMRVIKALQLGRDARKPSSEHQIKTWELARAVLAQDEAQGWHLLENPQRLQIMTIDALCASLVRQMPVLSEMGGLFSVTDDAEAIYRQAAKTTLTDLLRAEDPSLQALLLHLDNRQQLAVDLIAKMLANREQWLPLILQSEQGEALRATLEDHLSDLVTHLLEQVAREFEPGAWSSLQGLLDFAMQHAEPGTFPVAMYEVMAWSCPLPCDPSSVEGWKALYQWLFTTTGTPRKSPDKRNGFPAATEAGNKEEKALFAAMKSQMKAWLEDFSQNTALLAACQILPLLPMPYYPDNQWTILLALFQILPHACAQLQIQLQTSSEIDFSGVAQAALVALGHQDDPSALTLKLDYQLQHILVDEFQDTSLLQFALLEKLVAGWMPGDGRTLFLVGDPMQSIYRFRQAEVGLFLRVQAEGLGCMPVTPLFLRANFRSDPVIIDWINTIAPLCFAPHDDMNLGAIRYSPSDPAREAQENSRVELHATGDLLPTLHALLADETLQSIAILVRARTHLRDISVALKAADIPYQAVELEHLSVQSLVQDLMSLTRALVHLADSVAWLSFLRAPFCGFSLADLTRIRMTDPTACVWDNLCAVDLTSLSCEGQLILQRVMPLLAHAVHDRMAVPLHDAVKTLWWSLGGPACLSAEADLQMADSFFHLLSKHQRGGTLPDLNYLMYQLGRAFVKSTVGPCRVQVMTLHKAKGLEFDAVLLPELQRTPPRADPPLLLWERGLFAPIHPTQGEKDPLYDFLKASQQQKSALELGRLLYVGMTRAKRQLHLFARLTQNEEGKILSPSKGTLLSLLWPRLEDEFTVIFEPPMSESTEEVGPGSTRQTLRLAPEWVWPSDLPRITQPEAEAAPEENLVPVHEYTYLAHQQRQQGVLLHRLLYKIAMQGVGHWDSLDLARLEPSLRAQLRELGVGRGVNEVTQTLILAVQRVLSDPKGRWVLASHRDHEAEAVYGAAIIDRTFLDEAGVRWVIDYKTAQPQEQSLSAFYPSQFEQYRSQLAKYAQVFTDQGEKNIRLALYFPLCSGWIEWAPQETTYKETYDVR